MRLVKCEVCQKSDIEFDMEPTGYRHPACLKATQPKQKALHVEVADEIPGFDDPEDGSEARYDKRVAERPWLSHRLWWFVHNVISHPLIGIAPWRPFFRFHDWTSRRMHGR